MVKGSIDSTGLRTFRGIPFAAPPVGNLRWKPPQIPLRWAGIRNATSFGAACRQGTGAGSGSEDCLFVNVWTPAEPSNNWGRSVGPKLPVLVWVYGGSFTGGSGNIT